MHRNDIAGYIVVLILMATLVYIPTNSAETFTFSSILANIYCLFFLEKAITGVRLSLTEVLICNFLLVRDIK